MDSWNQLNLSQKDLERLFSKINYPGNDEDCWEWNACKNWDGYGTIGFSKKILFAHRIVYQCYNGLIPDDIKILHKCDNRKCVNPSHLFEGTQSDNMKDMAIKERTSSCLNIETVIYILNRIINGEIQSISQISKELDISERIFRRIIKGKTWKHVTCNYDLMKLQKILDSKRNPNKLVNINIEKIKDKIKDGYSQSQIAFEFNISQNTVSLIKRGKR